LRQPLLGDSIEERALLAALPSFWPGGMQPGQPLDVAATALMLAPGDNQITFTADTAAGYPGDVNVLLNRLGPMR